MTVHVERHGSTFDWTIKDELNLKYLQGFRFQSLAHIRDHVGFLTAEKKIQFLVKSNFK